MGVGHVGHSKEKLGDGKSETVKQRNNDNTMTKRKA
jgi:hypothetical protein